MKTVATIVVVIAAAAGVAYWTLGRDRAVQSQLIKGKVERGTIRISVSATGTLEAVRTVQVGSQISGQIAALHADYNSIVTKGQLLAEIDPRTLLSQVLTEQAQSASAQARLQSSQADLINQEANLVQVEANLKVTQVANENSALLYERAKQLMAKGLIAQSDLDVARTNAESAAAKVDQAQAAIRQAQAQIRSRQASVEQVRSDIVGAKAQLDRAEINLELTKIYSPVDGVVISRNVDIGQTVAASLSAPILFLIANDLTRMQVKANIDEADIGKITPDVQVSFSVDAYPSDTFSGKISEVRLEPQTVQNVVTYGVIVGVENPQLKLKPGMTANLTLVVDQHDNVLTVPNAALRFKPSGMTDEQIAKMIQDLPPLPGPPTNAPPGLENGAASSGSRGGPTADSPGADQRRGSGERRGRGGRRGGETAGETGTSGEGGERRDGNGSTFSGGTRLGGGENRFGGGEAAGFPGSGQGEGRRGGRSGGRGGGQGRNTRSVLWIQEAGTFKPMRVRTGLSDGKRTEVSAPDLMEATEIVVSDLSQTTTNTQQRPATNNSPFVPQIGGGRGRGGF